MSDSMDHLKVSLLVTYKNSPSGEKAFTQFLIAHGHFDDIPIDAPYPVMAAMVAQRNQVNALMRAMSIWPTDEKTPENARLIEAIARGYLQGGQV